MGVYELSEKGLRQFMEDQPEVAEDPRFRKALSAFFADIFELANIATNYAFDDIITTDRALAVLRADGLGLTVDAERAVVELESEIVPLVEEIDPSSPLAGEREVFSR